MSARVVRALLAVALAAGAVLLGFALPHAAVSQDTQHLVRGAHALMGCARARAVHPCAPLDGPGKSLVGPFPLLQYIPTVLMIGAGFSDPAIVRTLGALSLVAFVAMLGLLVHAGRAMAWRGWRALLVAVVLASPCISYATNPFGEVLAATLVLGATVAAVRRRPLLIFVLALAAGLGKETLPPFVVAFGLLAGRDADDGLLPPRRVVVPLVAGSALAVAIAVAFNEVRFGTWRNAAYLIPQYRIGQARAARNLWDLVASWGGGLAWFAVGFTLLVVLVAVTSLARLHSGPRRNALPGLAAVATVGGFLVGIASWWSPFGWVAWGPRLAVVIIPAGTVALVRAGGDDLERLVRSGLRRTSVAVAVGAVLAIAAWPQAAVPWRAAELFHLVQIRDGVCLPHPPTYTDRYYTCFDHLAWRHGHNQLLTAMWGGADAGLALQLAAAVAVASLVALAADAGTADVVMVSDQIP
jgi:hypothetical protein